MTKMSNNAIITVIIPAYNVEKYLPNCLDSLLQQTYKNLDIILVDDGSTDKPPIICDNYSRKDTRISVIHQKNGGVSAARLAGINIAKGDWLISVDADDRMEQDMIEKLYHTALSQQADFVFCDYDKEYPDYVEIVEQQLEKLDSINYLKQQMGGGMWGIYWNKLIKISIIKEHQIYPIVGLNMWEDYAVTNRWVIYAKKIAYCKEVLYHYNQCNMSAMTKQKSEKNYLDIKLAIDVLVEEINKAGIAKDLKQEIIAMKLFAKSYLINSPYKNYEKWINTYPDLNNEIISTTNLVDLPKSTLLIYKLLIKRRYKIVDTIRTYYKYKEKISRNLKKTLKMQ